ncbi:hypothetical protein AB0D08_27510 [Kitasatospora sp. NPDC048540]|uniref:hypothetical protein n=1 Tax=Kitasatospora sp. NPDC048540 TaxID=3155634 RepID=UPI0034003C5B
MSLADRNRLAEGILPLRQLLLNIVNDPNLFPANGQHLRSQFRTALDQLDAVGAFPEVIEALRLNDASSPRALVLDAALEQVGLTGQQLELKLEVVNWTRTRAFRAWDIALQRSPGVESEDDTGFDESQLGPDPEDDPDYDAGDHPDGSDPARHYRWRRARKLLAKLLKAIDDIFGSFISAIPNVGELIIEIKGALESLLDR